MPCQHATSARLVAELLSELHRDFGKATVVQRELITRSAIAIGIQATNGPILVGNSPHVARIDDAVAHVHPRDLADHQAAGFEIQLRV